MAQDLSCFRAWGDTLHRRTLLVQLKQPPQYLVIVQAARPTVRRSHGLVEFAVRVVEPSWTLVVEIGEGSLLEDRGGLAQQKAQSRSLTKRDAQRLRFQHR